MAVFNPQVPGTQDPNYLGYSKVVEAPAPNQSSALAVKATGEGLESGVSIADTLIKENIKDSATKAIDIQRDNYTAALEKMRDQTAQAPGVVPPPVQTSASGATSTGSLLDANASMDVPDGVEQGLDRISQLSEARKAAKINDTQYSMEVLSIAKRLRSQYGTGYRDYIDSEVSKVSGLPVANSYYQNLITDINRQLVQAAGQKDKLEAVYLKNLDVPNIVASYNMVKAGKMSETNFMEKIATWQNIQTKQRIDAAARAEKKDDQGFSVQDQTERLTNLSTNTVMFHLKDVNALSGMDSLGNLMTYITDVKAGRIQATDAEVQQRVSQLTAYRDVVYSRLNDQASGYAGTIGADNAQKIITQSIKPLDDFISLASSKDTGPAHFQARQLEATTNSAKLDYLVNKSTYAANKQVIGARAIWGDQYMPEYIRNIIGNKLDEAYRAPFEQEALSAVAPYEDKRGKPVQRYMIDAIQHGKSIDAPADYFGSITNLVKTIGDPKAPLEGKDKMIEWAFNPKNVKALDELKMDYRDPNTGEIVPGKWRAFNILSSDAIVQGVKETAKVKPENYTKFQSTVEQQFGTLLRSDVQTLNGIVTKPYLGVHFSWNDETKELGLVDKNNRPVIRNPRALGIEQPNVVYLNSALDIVDRVNSGISNLANVQKNNPKGGDVDTYIFRTLSDVNFDPKGTISGVRADILKSIFKTRNPEATPDDLNNMLRKIKLPAVQPLDDFPNHSASPPVSR